MFWHHRITHKTEVVTVYCGFVWNLCGEHAQIHRVLFCWWWGSHSQRIYFGAHTYRSYSKMAFHSFILNVWTSVSICDFYFYPISIRPMRLDFSRVHFMLRQPPHFLIYYSYVCLFHRYSFHHHQQSPHTHPNHTQRWSKEMKIKTIICYIMLDRFLFCIVLNMNVWEHRAVVVLDDHHHHHHYHCRVYIHRTHLKINQFEEFWIQMRIAKLNRLWKFFFFLLSWQFGYLFSTHKSVSTNKL